MVACDADTDADATTRAQNEFTWKRKKWVQLRLGRCADDDNGRWTTEVVVKAIPESLSLLHIHTHTHALIYTTPCTHSHAHGFIRFICEFIFMGPRAAAGK